MSLLIGLLMTVSPLDTLPAILKVKDGNIHKYVMGKVVLTKDCKVVEFLQVNTWKRKEKVFPFKGKVVDYRLVNSN